jgi:hypothetical protein
MSQVHDSQISLPGFEKKRSENKGIQAGPCWAAEAYLLRGE